MPVTGFLVDDGVQAKKHFVHWRQRVADQRGAAQQKAVRRGYRGLCSGGVVGDGQLVRSAGNSAQLMAKEGKYATLRLPSGEMRMVPIICRASIGVVGNGDHNLINIGKAGRKRHMGIRPTVRGSVMNPNDHPHGGGEGKTGIGRPGPCTPSTECCGGR